MPRTDSLIQAAHQDVLRWEEEYFPVLMENHRKVAAAFSRHRVSQDCFAGSSGYGYGDHGRDTLDAVYAEVFRAEDALVRVHFASGTHVLMLVLDALLPPGSHLVSLTGAPYDTLTNALGLRGAGPGTGTDRGRQSFCGERGVRYTQIELSPDGGGVEEQIPPDATVVFIQRSRGYEFRPSLSVGEIGALCRAASRRAPGAVRMVDNCYGEFTQAEEPLEEGADLIAGSLIKNPGGGLAPAGGYVAGKRHLVERIAERLTAPGIGRHVGATGGDWMRLLYQGLYLAPRTVSEMLKGRVFAASLLGALGYEVSPRPDESGRDTVLAIRFGSARSLEVFVESIQGASPVDSHVLARPWEMPGYDDPVIMAAGTFVSGATSELSADAPVRPPYTAYLQGGLSFPYTRIALEQAVLRLLETP